MRLFPFFFAVAAICWPLAGSLFAANAKASINIKANSISERQLSQRLSPDHESVYSQASFIETREPVIPSEPAKNPGFSQFSAQALPESTPERSEIVFGDGFRDESSKKGDENFEFEFEDATDYGRSANFSQDSFRLGFDRAVNADLPEYRSVKTARMADEQLSGQNSDENEVVQLTHLVPEPGTFILIGLAALGLPFAGKFRSIRSKSSV